MKPRVLLYVLIISVMPITFVSDTNTQVPVLPDIPRKFKVCVYVRPDDDTHLDERLESFIRRELRALGDVNIVKGDSDWDYLLAFDILEHDTGMVSIANTALVKTLDHDRERSRLFELFGPPGHFLDIVTAYYSIDNLLKYAITNVGSFDKVYLELLRNE